MEPIHYLRVIRRRWWVVVAAVVVSVAAAWVTTTTVTQTAAVSAPTYSATTVLWDPGVSSVGRGSVITDVNTLAQVVTLPNVAAAAAREMHYQGDPLALRSQVSASADESVGFLKITGFAPDPKTAEAISTAFSRGLISYLGELKAGQIDQEQRLLRAQIKVVRQQGLGPDAVASLRTLLAQSALDRSTPTSLTAIQQAKAEAIPVQGFQPPRSRNSRAALAALVGLLAGLALALILERFDTRIYTRRATEEAFRLPVLAEVPAIARRRRKRVVTTSDPTSRAADAFRLLSVGVARWAADGEGQTNGNDGTGAVSPRKKTILVTSPEARDGKSMVAANLAAALAESGKRVLVLSCDLRRPTIDKLFGVPDSPGVTEVLTMSNGNGKRDPDKRIDLAPYIGLPATAMVGVIPTGATPLRPGELLGSDNMQRLIESAKSIAHFVILDCAPMVVASDVVPLLPQADAVVLVARAGKTRGEVAERTIDLLGGLGARIAGIVLNDARESSASMAKRRFYRPTRRTRNAARNKRPSESPQSHGDANREMWAGLG